MDFRKIIINSEDMPLINDVHDCWDFFSNQKAVKLDAGDQITIKSSKSEKEILKEYPEFYIFRKFTYKPHWYSRKQIIGYILAYKG